MKGVCEYEQTHMDSYVSFGKSLKGSAFLMVAQLIEKQLQHPPLTFLWFYLILLANLSVSFTASPRRKNSSVSVNTYVCVCECVSPKRDIKLKLFCFWPHLIFPLILTSEESSTHTIQVYKHAHALTHSQSLLV